MNSSWQNVSQKLSQALGRKVDFVDKTSVSGGCINQCWELIDTSNKT